jgi:Tol biopolymer transport system component
MITGKKVFDAKSRVLLMSAIATHEPPPLSQADPATPPEFEHIIATCLAKDPADRWQAAGDVLAELRALADGDTDTDAGGSSARTSGRSSAMQRGMVAAAVVAAVGVSAPAILYLRGEAAPAELRFRVPIQLTAQPNAANVAGVAAGALFSAASFSLSPDGRVLAFTARTTAAEPLTLYVRPVGGVVSQALAPTQGGMAQPFWSADGRSLAFVSGGRLRKIAAAGGAPQDLCPVRDFYGGSWNRDNVIIFGSAGGIFRVAGEGGTPEAITSLDASETGHFWPSFLPDGRRFLYTAWSGDLSARAVYVGELGKEERTRVVAAESNAVYSATGHLLFHRGKAIFAQPFDVSSLTLSGEPVRVADEVTFREEDGRGHFAVSQSGALAYFENSGATVAAGPQAEGSEWHLAWATRTSQQLDRPGRSGIYRGVEVSPDTTRIAVHRHEAEGGDIWIVEPSGSETRLTWNAAQHNSSPIWSPDGREIAFSSLRDGKPGVYRKRSDGSGAEELLHESHAPVAPMSWSPDGMSIVIGVQDPKTRGDLWLLSVAEKKAVPLVNTPALETHAQISPDGRWLAYSSDGVGNRREIHVQPFPSGQGRWQISDAGGDWPRWRKDGRELYYHSIGPAANPQTPGPLSFIGPLSAAAINGTGNSLEHGAPKPFLSVRALNFPHTGGDYHTYAVSPDGQRFLYFQFVVPTPTTAQTSTPDHTSGLVVAMNWDSALRK